MINIDYERSKIWCHLWPVHNWRNSSSLNFWIIELRQWFLHLLFGWIYKPRGLLAIFQCCSNSNCGNGKYSRIQYDETGKINGPFTDTEISCLREIWGLQKPDLLQSAHYRWEKKKQKTKTPSLELLENSAAVTLKLLSHVYRYMRINNSA